MRLFDSVEVLELQMLGVTGRSVIHPTLIWDGDTVMMIDAGFPGLLPEIREAMSNAGIPFDKLNKVAITHQDIDHIGSLPDIVREAPHQIEVLAHVEEKPYIEGTKPLIKLDPDRLLKMAGSLPKEQRRQMEALMANPPKAHVDTTVVDGQVLPYCGGITVIFTPGHTPGHICLYLNHSKILVAGDAMVVVEGELRGPNPRSAYDIDTAVKSLQKLTPFNIETVVCYHGGVYEDGASARIAELASASD